MNAPFDLLVLGAGSGGVAAARRAASHGARVAIVEGSRVGGTCVIRGCVPKKLLMYAAQYGDAAREARGYGWPAEPVGFDMPAWAAAKALETQRLERIYEDMLDHAGVQRFEGWARFESAGSVSVGSHTLTAHKVLIATGAEPVRDGIPGIGACLTSDEFLDLQQLPASAAVLGGGYIAVEFASMLARLGVQTHLFMRAALPLRGFDDDLRLRVVTALRAAGVHVHAESFPQRIEHGEHGATLGAAGFGQVFGLVLNATGRRPATRRLGLAAAGVELDEGGSIRVDAQMQTSAAGVFAVGDVTRDVQLTPVAIAKGRALADRLFGTPGPEVDHSLVPSAVFCLPPLASVGLSEIAAHASGRALRIFEADFRPMRQAFIGGAERAYMKLVVDADTDRVLGVHMIGADAPEIIQSLAVALSAGATKAAFDRTLALHPSAAEEFVLMRAPSRTTMAAVPAVPAAIALPSAAALPALPA